MIYKAKVIQNSGVQMVGRQSGVGDYPACTIKLMLVDESYDFFDSETGAKKTGHGYVTFTEVNDRAEKLAALAVNQAVVVDFTHHLRDGKYNQLRLRNIKPVPTEETPEF